MEFRRMTGVETGVYRPLAGIEMSSPAQCAWPHVRPAEGRGRAWVAGSAHKFPCVY
jgi:hypothetical protein